MGEGEFKYIFISAVDGAFWFDNKYQTKILHLLQKAVFFILYVKKQRSEV